MEDNNDRLIPHINGQFASSIFVRIKSSKKFDKLRINLKNSILIEDLHISLFSEFYLLHHETKNLQEDLKSLEIAKFRISILPEIVQLKNSTGTKFFIGLKVKYTKALKKAVLSIEELLFKRGISRSFEGDFICHLSIGWMREEIDVDEFKDLLGSEELKIIEVKEIIFKCGKKENKIDLK